VAIDFQMVDFFYPWQLWRLRRIFKETPYWPAGEIRLYQERLLAVIVRQAFEQVPYYRRLFALSGISPEDIRCRDDLKKIPPTTPEDLRRGGRDFLAANAAKYAPVAYATSGTTGAPATLWLDRNARVLEFVYYWRHWSWAGYRLGDRFAELGTFFFLRKNLGERLVVPQPLLGRLMINSARIGPGTAGKIAAAMKSWRAGYLKGTASALYFLAGSFAEAGIDDVSFRAAFSTGELLTPLFRRRIESVFHCRVLDSYGHMEGAVAVSECPAGGYHVNEDYGLLDLSEAQAAAGSLTAKVVGTSLYNMAMPLLRYEVGDQIEVFGTEKTCPCGRKFPLVKAVSGRSEDVVRTPAGCYATSLAVLPETAAGARCVQFIQERTDRLRVLVVPGPGWGDEQRDRLRRNVRAVVGGEMKIFMNDVRREDLEVGPAGKFRVVVSRSDRPDGP